MKIYIKNLTIFITVTILVFQGVAVSEVSTLENHLNLYPAQEHSKTAHENIDTNEHTHTHKHKHSDEDEEHDHSHDHLNFAHNLVLSSERAFEIATDLVVSKSQSNFQNVFHFSTQHPSTLFRPPIKLA